MKSSVPDASGAVSSSMRPPNHVLFALRWPTWHAVNGVFRMEASGKRRIYEREKQRAAQCIQGQDAQWAAKRSGVCTTNGAVLAVIHRSSCIQPVPDLLCFALLGYFRGYYPGYSAQFAKQLDVLTWAVLKGHTVNRGGEVLLRSRDPLDPPYINFHYFQEGTDKKGEDLDAVVSGIRFVRTMTKDLIAQGIIAAEEIPGPHAQTDNELRQFVRDNAWGHHASCTCPIGNKEDGGVLSSDFKVHGTEGLRVVDASVFPRIPGLFILTAVYMIGEKAADVILEETKKR